MKQNDLTAKWFRLLGTIAIRLCGDSTFHRAFSGMGMSALSGPWWADDPGDEKADQVDGSIGELSQFHEN